MISNQTIQTTLDEVRAISRIDFCVMDVTGSVAASTFDTEDIPKESITAFVNSPAESQSFMGCNFFKVMDDTQAAYILLARGAGEDAYTIGKLVVCQLQNLIIAYKERYDRNNFIQNLLLDNLLLVDIYSQAKKLLMDIEARRVVYLIETRDEKDVSTLETVRSLFAPQSQDVITSVDENHIVVVKELKDDDTYESMNRIAELLVDMLNTEVIRKVRVSYGTAVDHIKDVSRSYKEARMAMGVGEVFYPDKAVVSYHTLGIGRLIYQLPQPLCEMFIREVFGDISPDSFDEETLATINRFFTDNLNVSETARQLFVHRNTLVYRLEKLQRNTGLDIRNFEDALTFKIGLMVSDYMKYLERLHSRP